MSRADVDAPDLREDLGGEAAVRASQRCLAQPPPALMYLGVQARRVPPVGPPCEQNPHENREDGAGSGEHERAEEGGGHRGFLRSKVREA